MKSRNDDCSDLDGTSASTSTDTGWLDASSLYIPVLAVKVLFIRKISWMILLNINVTVRNFRPDGNPKSDEASEFAHLGGQGYGSTQQVDSCLEGYRFRVGFECACR